MSFFRLFKEVLLSNLLIFILPVWCKNPEGIPKILLPKTGKIIDSYFIMDIPDSSWFIVYEDEKGKLGQNGYRNNLIAGQFEIHAGKVKTIWKLNDFNENPLESIEYLPKSFTSIDLNQDGKLDFLVWYRKISDGTDPDILKIFVYINGKKYALRGRIPKLGTDLDLYEYTLDSSSQKSTLTIRRALISKWENLTQAEMDSLRREMQEIGKE